MSSALPCRDALSAKVISRERDYWEAKARKLEAELELAQLEAKDLRAEVANLRGSNGVTFLGGDR